MECFHNILQHPLCHYLFSLCEYKVYVILKWMLTFKEKGCKFNNKVLLILLLIGLVVFSSSDFPLSHWTRILFCLPLAWSEHSCRTWSHLILSGWVQSMWLTDVRFRNNPSNFWVWVWLIFLSLIPSSHPHLPVSSLMRKGLFFF